jgi:hypothetical protein
VLGFYHQQERRPVEKLVEEIECSSKEAKKNKSKIITQINLWLNQTNPDRNKKPPATNHV